MTVSNTNEEKVVSLDKAHLLFTPRKHYIDRNFTEADILQLVKTQDLRKSIYEQLENYYLGRHDILFRSFEDPTKPNNRTVNNYSKLIVDTGVAYFLGEPVSYTSDDKKLMDRLQEVFDYNQSDDVNVELAKMCGIYGHAFEVYWIDEEGELRFKHLSPKELVLCHSMDIEEKPVCAVKHVRRRDIRTGTEILHVEVYTDTHISYYRGDYTKLELIETKEHYFGMVPVTEYIANEERQGDFEGVITLIDAYNVAVADSVNDIEYWNDAYLLLTGLQATKKEDIDEMKQNRVMSVDEGGHAEFLVKNVNDTHIENIKDRLTQDIHKFAFTPNLSDEQFATNLSGVAIKYKLLGLENRTSIKERKFRSSLRRRLRVVTRFLNLKGGTYDDRKINPIFSRNIPANIPELSDMITKLRGVVSDKTLIGQLPFVENLESELKEIEAQREKEMGEGFLFEGPSTGDLMKSFNTKEELPGKEPEEEKEEKTKGNDKEVVKK